MPQTAEPIQTHFVLDITQHHPFALELDGENYDFHYSRFGVAQLEEELERSMNTFSDWLKINTDELIAVLQAGLEPEYEENEAHEIAMTISNSLSVEAFDKLVETLSVAAFPQAVERYYGVLASLQHNAEASPSTDGAAG